MGIALWLAPSQSSLEGIHLSSLITSLATNHSTPLFAPHVTLLTGIDASTPPTELLATIRSALATFPTPAGPFSLTLTSLGSKADEKNYFQYLFVKVDPNAKLLALRKAVREALLPEAVAAKPDDFFPHLSLMYGEDTKNRAAKAVIRELEERGRGAAGVETIAVGEVLLVKCEGTPEEWEVLGRVPL